MTLNLKKIPVNQLIGPRMYIEKILAYNAVYLCFKLLFYACPTSGPGPFRNSGI